MTLVQSIDRVVEWLKQQVCGQITLKIPDDYKNDHDYGVIYAHPAAFPLYIPTQEVKLPPSVAAPYPSVCAQLVKGKDDLMSNLRQMQIRLCLSCWNPGKHGREFLHPRENQQAVGGLSYYRATDETIQMYTRDMEGWKDSFNFADVILRELENAEYINGLRIVQEEGVQFGLFTEEGEIWSYYPYWHTYITVMLESGIRRNPAYQELL